MNDRFKFRAWDRKNLKFYKWDGIFNFPDPSYEFDTIQQSTGLRDKNGVLIYEGDIVEYGSTGRAPFYAVCELEGCSFGLRVYESVDFNWFDNDLYYEAHFYEVIGNKYENSELLESS